MNELYRKTVGGFKLFADRAVCDEDGNNIKTTKQNHNIADVTPVANAMNLLATTSSGDIVRTNLEFNTALTTKFLSQSGAWLTVDSDSWKKYSVDHGCTGDDSSIYIGTNNSALGKSILFGVGNSTSGVSGIKNHATLIGFDNTSTSDIEYFERTINDVTTQVQCNSILMGSKNTSEHHNAILIGMLNNALEPLTAADKTVNTHDDGFMLAIGYSNTVGRNYDIAMGYSSTANGGENIAMQHSTATGYCNIAMESSTVTNGISNIVLSNSTITTYTGSVDSNTGVRVNRNVVYNVLHDATLTNTNQYAYVGKNNMSHAKLNITGTASASSSTPNTHGNILTNAGITVAGAFTNNVVMNIGELNGAMNINAASCSDNVVIGNPNSSFSDYSYSTYPITITGFGAVDRNLMYDSQIYEMLCSNPTSNGNKCVTDNKILHSTVSYKFNFTQAYTGSVFAFNTIDTSFIDVDVESSRNNLTMTLDHNVLMCRSKICYKSSDFPNDVVFPECTNNNLMFNSFLFWQPYDQITTTYGNSIRNNTDNFLFGTVGNKVTGCFSFCDDYEHKRSQTTVSKSSNALLNCALRAFNFGDGSLADVANVANFGTNTLTHSSTTFAFGQNNHIYGTENASTACLFVFGEGNGVSISGTGNSGGIRNILFGVNNSLSGSSLFNNTLVGENNQIDGSNMGLVYVYGRGNRLTNTGKLQSYTVFGTGNYLYSMDNQSDWTADCFVQGSYNTISNGSNIIVMGSGITATGHNAMAIGNQLIANKWQTVLGKYNAATTGTNRLMEAYNSSKTYTNSSYVSYNKVPYRLKAGQTASGSWDASKWENAWPDGDKVLFAIGHGYSTNEDSLNQAWRNEDYITRANAIQVMGDGKFIALEGLSSWNTSYFNNGMYLSSGDFTVTSGNISVGGDISVVGTVTASNIPPAPSGNGQYSLTCTVNNGTVTYTWVPIGYTTVS